MTNNNVRICGNVTFAKSYSDGKVVSIGIGASYKDGDKEFTAYPTIKAFASVEKTGFDNVTDIEKGDMVEVVGHFVTRSYDDKNGNKKFTTEIIADSIICG